MLGEYDQGRPITRIVAGIADASPPSPEPVDIVNHPPHYKPLDGVDFDCIELARRLSFDIGNAIKYVWRAEAKNGRQDLEKARWYLRDAIVANDPIYPIIVDPRLSQRTKTRELFSTLVAAQTDPMRKLFFAAIRDELLDIALLALEKMLAA